LSVGLGVRTNPVIDGRDIPLVFVPKLSYYGKRFFLENLDFGATLYEDDAQGFNLIATPGYDRVFFSRNDPQNFFISSAASLPSPQPQRSDAERILDRNRQITYLVGPEWHFEFHSLTGQLDLLYEITGRHSGTEVRTALALPLLKSHGVLNATVGATWKSRALVTYYYGEPGIYDANSAFNPFVKLSYAIPLTAHWGVNAFAHVEWLGSSIAHSPIVVDSRVTTVFAGVTYSF